MIYELLAPFLLLLHALTFIDAFSSPVLQLKAPASSFHTRISSASRDQRFFAETHSHCSSTSSKLPPLHCNDRIYRDDFLGLVRKLALGSLGVFTAAKANPANAARPTSPNRPNLAKFIDVEVDLGGGLILTIRQPFADDTGAEKVASDGGDRQGTYVWPAGSDLAKFLLSDVGRGLVSGKRVVELGAGTAIAGLAASVAGASATYLTDGMTGMYNAWLYYTCQCLPGFVIHVCC